ncbi:1-acyl-sn-glycerol-3-phosphate acyltransferase [Asinibacterium sp. OR53]|uniref:1-acyl-sn-glycerol-3-phosphate acyltransferase n=1 Tax=Asinibacterium sp. OR53 TaxID=925409 RepID=UPI00047AA1A8|nr:1-acyl-sn-glycerol-3-phosphate acyltransferase [Asinibacterium sp. OR53]
MIYSLVRIFIRAGVRIFCRNITYNHRHPLQYKGPLLLACNHPNSFLDAVILGSRFQQPVHFLARGDAFRKPFARKLLTALQLIPIYRLSEGREYLALNEATFERCHQVLSQNGIVLIFSEGLCVNNWHLRPFKKGTARIALKAWEDPLIRDRFCVLPVSLNYNSFHYLGKRLVIHFHTEITKDAISAISTEAERTNHFNTLLVAGLEEGMIQSRGDHATVQLLISNHRYFKNTLGYPVKALREKQAFAEKIFPIHAARPPYLLARGPVNCGLHGIIVTLLFIPAMAAYILHIPLYLPLSSFIRHKTKDTVFYDSVLFVALLLLYPVYWLLMCLFGFLLTDQVIVRIVFILLPFWAYLYMVCKDSWERSRNYLLLTAAQQQQLRYLFP